MFEVHTVYECLTVLLGKDESDFKYDVSIGEAKYLEQKGLLALLPLQEYRSSLSRLESFSEVEDKMGAAFRNKDCFSKEVKTLEGRLSSVVYRVVSSRATLDVCAQELVRARHHVQLAVAATQVLSPVYEELQKLQESLKGFSASDHFAYRLKPAAAKMQRFLAVYLEGYPKCALMPTPSYSFDEFEQSEVYHWDMRKLRRELKKRRKAAENQFPPLQVPPKSKKGRNRGKKSSP